MRVTVNVKSDIMLKKTCTFEQHIQSIIQYYSSHPNLTICDGIHNNISTCISVI